MKEISTISTVFGIIPTRENLVAFASDEESGLRHEAFFVNVKDFYTAKSSDECVIFQTSESGAVSLLTSDLQTMKFEGDYSILKAFKFINGFIIIDRKSKSYNYIEPQVASSTDLGFYFKKSGNLDERYLFKRLGDEITLFSLSKKEEIRIFNIPRDFGIDASPAEGVFHLEPTIYIPLSNGQLLAFDISTDELKWKQERVGRTAIFEDKIYCIADYTIKELDANTGEILRQESMQGLIDTYGFRPTGAHKVYDEYIFIMTSGKPGMVAIYDRRTLKFQEMLKLDEMIPLGTDHLHWHNGKLYILDFGKTLHVYE
ncbi:PQQ-like beta-propeller repeat protein [Reichenbachiella agarivorans]|uniref:PQQ-like beta-propeller repeat protein n=1 Tax=Reichenbachiella agarivorans TaxID=2979464 RepID=A0ABY6CTP1_9BACT|nr:PQQ-like beta-propeller repeat protein [Reichenbachiella agarivorans]UXP33894.1 PQQ-like beta-propeller repeat protein [Reichenbachiella agarivorans]